MFEQNFRERHELGASISVWCDGEELLSVGQGWCEREKQRKWTTDSIVPVYSATKGPAAATLLVTLETRGLGPETPVAEVWPKFPMPGATFAQLLSHQCGLAALDRPADITNHAEVVAAIEAQTPARRLGSGHAYHPRTFGALVEEPVRRLAGKPLGVVWREAIARPLELDFWIGLPEAQWPRVARLYPGRAESGKADAFYEQFSIPGSLTQRAFASPKGLHSVERMNHPPAWASGIPALGGIGTARALAKFYQAAIGALESPLSVAVQQALMEAQSQAFDDVLRRETVFTCGCQRDPLDAKGNKTRQIYGPSKSAFGHPGAGGSHAMGDPETGVSFGYVMNQMTLSAMPGVKCLEMVHAIFAEMEDR